jgi:hypothetical protein
VKDINLLIRFVTSATAKNVVSAYYRDALRAMRNSDRSIHIICFSQNYRQAAMGSRCM